MANLLSTISKSIATLGSLKSKFGGRNSFGGSLYYPIDIIDVPDRPLLQLTCKVPLQGYTNIYFPMPENVQMNDSMSYNSHDLNILGFAAQQAVRTGMSAENAGQAFREEAANASNIISQLFPGSRAAAAQTIAQATTDNQEVLAGIASVTQITQNKNTVTTFDGVGIRTHQFTYKMIARSPEESEMIKKIQFALRSGMYPTNVTGQENMRLHFPPQWSIRYVSLPHLRDLEHLPQPYDCFLQTLNTNFNSSTKMWRYDKAPLEVDVAFTFVETKALTEREIADMQGGFSADGSSSGENVTQATLNWARSKVTKYAGPDFTAGVDSAAGSFNGWLNGSNAPLVPGSVGTGNPAKVTFTNTELPTIKLP